MKISTALQTRRRTSYRLWAALSIIFFIGFGFVPLPGATKADSRYWSLLERMLTGNYTVAVKEYFLIMAFYTSALFLPAALLGWVFQAIIVLLSARVPATRKA